MKSRKTMGLSIPVRKPAAKNAPGCPRIDRNGVTLVRTRGEHGEIFQEQRRHSRIKSGRQRQEVSPKIATSDKVRRVGKMGKLANGTSDPPRTTEKCLAGGGTSTQVFSCTEGTGRTLIVPRAEVLGSEFFFRPLERSSGVLKETSVVRVVFPTAGVSGRVKVHRYGRISRVAGESRSGRSEKGLVEGAGRQLSRRQSSADSRGDRPGRESGHSERMNGVVGRKD